MKMQWLTTSPNPRVHPTGVNFGQRGWKLHAVETDSDSFKEVRRLAAICGLRASHGWDLDLFIQDKCRRCSAKLTKAAEPQILKDGMVTYAVIGASGARAGTIQRVGPKNGGMWEVQMVASPREMVRFFKDAKAEAIELARRY